MAALVEHEAAPLVARLVLDAASPHTAFAETGQLQQGLFCIKQPRFGRGLQVNLFGCDGELIAFVSHSQLFPQFDADGSGRRLGRLVDGL